MRGSRKRYLARNNMGTTASRKGKSTTPIINVATKRPSFFLKAWRPIGAGFGIISTLVLGVIGSNPNILYAIPFIIFIATAFGIHHWVQYLKSDTKSIVSVPASANPNITSILGVDDRAFTFSIGPDKREFTRAQLESGPQSILRDNGRDVISVSLKNGQPVINAEMYIDPRDPPILLREGIVSGLPKGFDANFKQNNALEVVTRLWMPIFQVRYTSKTDVEFRGTFMVSGGKLFVNSNDSEYFFGSLKANQVVPALPRLFKYPAKIFPGEFNDGKNRLILPRPIVVIRFNPKVEGAETQADALSNFIQKKIGVNVITAVHLDDGSKLPFPFMACARNSSFSEVAARISEALTKNDIVWYPYSPTFSGKEWGTCDIYIDVGSKPLDLPSN